MVRRVAALNRLAKLLECGYRYCLPVVGRPPRVAARCGINLGVLWLVAGILWVRLAGELPRWFPIGPDGRSHTPVGSTVNVANADYTNSIGDALLMGHWKDPEFDADLHAFYYVRVIEIPTPRWTAYDAKRFGIVMPDKVTMTVQDRAYTSPIWYTP